MKLTELNPRRLGISGEGVEIAHGFSFECPCCIGTPRAIRLAIEVNPVWDPKAQMAVLNLTTENLHYAAKHVWNRTGDDWEHLTVTPSIDASQHGHWHGFITNGEIK